MIRVWGFLPEHMATWDLRCSFWLLKSNKLRKTALDHNQEDANQPHTAVIACTPIESHLGHQKDGDHLAGGVEVPEAKGPRVKS